MFLCIKILSTSNQIQTAAFTVLKTFSWTYIKRGRVRINFIVGWWLSCSNLLNGTLQLWRKTISGALCQSRIVWENLGTKLPTGWENFDWLLPHFSSLFPSDWCKSVIVPLFKKGDDKKTDNYRGISLLSIVSKLFTSRLTNMGRNNTKCFRKGYSIIGKYLQWRINFTVDVA